MGEYELTSGAISTIMDGGTVESPIFQVLGYKKIQGVGDFPERFRLNLSDGLHSYSYVMLSTNLVPYISDGRLLGNGAVIQVEKLITNADNGIRVILILGFTLCTPVGSIQPKLGNPIQWILNDSEHEENFNFGIER